LIFGREFAGAAAVLLAVLGGGTCAVAQETQSPPVSVTVYDSWFEPYTAYGRSEAGGAVIVFDQPAVRPATPPPAPLSVLPAKPAAPDLGPPLETAAGRSAQSAPAVPPVAPQTAPAPASVQKPPQSASEAGSEDRYVEGTYAINLDYWLSYPQNLYRIGTAPARFDRGDWITAALAVGAGGALLLLDESLMDFWQNDVKSDATGSAADIFREFGDSKNIIFGSLAAYALAETLDSTGVLDARREKSAALLSLESFLLTQGIVTGMKYVTGRNRPEDTNDAFDFEGPTKGDVNASFPSGHAGSAFAVASVLSETYGEDNPWVPYLAYTVATGAALARVDDNRHWFSDVFVGGAIGYFVGQTVTRYSPFLKRNNITLLPFGSSDARGIGVAYRF